MRTCGYCKSAVRADDPLATVQVMVNAATLTVAACENCTARLTGQAEPEPRTYPPGLNYSFRVCGICRTAMPEQDLGECIRLAPADVSDGMAPGCYQACALCVQLFGPRIYRSEEHTSELQSRGHLVC